MKKIFRNMILSAVTLSVAGSVLSGAAFFSASVPKLSAEDPYAILDDLAATSAAADARGEYRLETVLDVAYGKVYRFRQVHDGADVVGSEVIVSADGDGNVLSVSGAYRSMDGLPAARLSENEILSSFGGEGEPLSCEPVVYSLGSDCVPAYSVLTDLGGGTRWYVSAVNGEILLSAPESSYVMRPLQNAKGERITLDIDYDPEDGIYALGDSNRLIFTYDLHNAVSSNGGLDLSGATPYTSTTGNFEAVAVSAFENVVKSYDFFADAGNVGVSVEGLNGLPMLIMVHYGVHEENAMYINQSMANYMLIGDGNNSPGTLQSQPVLYQTAKATDIIAHEYQHGITNIAANLLKVNDAGALDEAFSDVFGALIEGKELSDSDNGFWDMGEDATNPGVTVVRSMKRQVRGQHFTVSEKETGNDDNGGIHNNSTIISHLVYTTWQKAPEFFTKQEIGKLWYSTLCTLPAAATFDDFTRQFRRTARALGYSDEIRADIDECLRNSGLLRDDLLNYTVTFRNWDNTVLKEEIVHEGGNATAPADPTREPSNRYEYIFDRWDVSFENVMDDLTVKAVYREVARKYAVVFVDDAGNVLQTFDGLAYGDVLPSAMPAGPQKAPDEMYVYEFLGWDWEPPVTGDATVRPQYKQTLRDYEVTFYLDGKVYQTLTLHYGDALSSPAERPAAFDGWYLDENMTERAGRTFTGSVSLYGKGNGGKGNVLAIALGVGGGVLAVGIGVTLFFVLRRKKR